MHVIDLLLKLASEIFNLFLLLFQLDVERFGLRPQARVLVSGDVVLDLEISVHVPDLFFLEGFENGRLVRFQGVLVVLGKHSSGDVVV